MKPTSWHAALIAIAASCVYAKALSGQPPVADRTSVLRRVNEALATSKSGDYAATRQRLDLWLASCPVGPSGQQCRTLYASGLGTLLQREASEDRRRGDSLYLAAVSYYDRILAEVPGHSEAIYGKALAYRAMGPHEWQESFFAQAPTVDAGRSALYFTFLGDYYASQRRWPQAARAYKQATEQDPDDDGARAGLIAALAESGQQGQSELRQQARSWELRYPASAVDAYRAVLAASVAPTGQGDAQADTAIVRLVSLQARNRLGLADVPDSVNPNWTPLREIRSFLGTGQRQDAVWWMKDEQRRTALAQAALAGGRAAVSARKYDVAEKLWSEGVQLAEKSSSVSLDLQRELALLYFHQPTLDANGQKFDALEQNIFEGKFGALSTGDLEAAQRFHTTLGLIYQARGVWKSGTFAHNAQQQLTWALEKADERQRRQSFYQALPELRLLLARGLDSTGSRQQAARTYVEAARAFLDTDDLSAAERALSDASRLGENTDRLRRVLALRSEVAEAPASANAACAAERLATLGASGDQNFAQRQRFKVLADCTRSGTPNDRRRRAIAAFELVDSARVQLVGGGDVARFERVMQTLLTPFDVAFRPAHLDQTPPPGGPVIQVQLGAETVPLAYSAALDDIIAARVVARLGSAVQPFPMKVEGGVVFVPSTPGVPLNTLMQLKGKAGVRDVKVR